MVVWQPSPHDVFTIMKCLHRVQAVDEYRPAREIDDVLQITIIESSLLFTVLKLGVGTGQE